MTRIEYLGHAAFLVKGSASILIDPFLDGNPKASRGPAEVDPDLILVTHAHDDHVGDAVAISARTGCPVMEGIQPSNPVTLEPYNHSHVISVNLWFDDCAGNPDHRV